MGGAVSELRGEIHTHVLIVQHYPMFLEPVLAAVQYFLHAAEQGEGTNRNNPLEEISMDVVITDKKVFEEASTEVELLSENPAVTEALLHAVRNYRKLELAPDIDTFKRWYDPPWVKNKPFPKFVLVAPDEVQQFRIAVLRTSIRCLRLMMFCEEGKRQLEEAGGPAVLNQAAVENSLDDFSSEQANPKTVDPVEFERRALFADLDTYAVSILVTETLNRFDVDKFLSLYVHVCRYISFVAVEAREMQREKKAEGQAEADRLAKILAKTPESSEWLSLLEKKKAPPPPPVDASGQASSLESLAVVDFTPTEIGQQALWALDLLATLDFNIRLDPDGKELGAVLILTRRLRLIRWDQVGAPSPDKAKRKADL
eukprot:jgi/Phyca11/9389/fgenesh1_pm.PHYCAscaffold_37_\